MRSHIKSLCLLSVLLGITGPTSHIFAGDWPQILGPNRNGVATGERLLGQWPEAGPNQLWQAKLGEGYAGVAVAGERVIAFHRVGELDRVECFAAKSGQSLWQADYEATYRGGINSDKGPRASPVIAGSRIIAFAANGDLHCTHLISGKKLWTRQLYVDYEAPEGYFGAGSTPLVVDDRVIVNVGSRDDAAMVCLKLSDGKTLWNAYSDTASYSSPILFTHSGQPAVLALTRLNCVALDPATGKVLFEFPFGQRGPTVSAAVPLIVDRDRLFLTASYGIGAHWLKLDGSGAKPLWSNDTSLSSQYTTPVHYQGMLFGTHGREDIGVAKLRAVHAATGRIAWEQNDFGVAHTIVADDKLLLIKISGELQLAETSAESFNSIASAQVAAATIRAVPALANGRLYLRSTTDAGGKLTCIQVGPLK